MNLPILFSTPMVQAILEGRKSQTRRIIKPQPKDHDHLAYSEADWKDEKPEYVTTEGINAWFCKYCGEGISMMDGKPMYKCPYGKPGDKLWVRETFGISGNRLFYRADRNDYENAGLQGLYDFKWKPSIFMPNKLSRIDLEVTDVRVERLQDITEEDAIAEGIMDAPGMFKIGYRHLWESINGQGSWNLNPWVWVVTFKDSEGEDAT